MRTEPFSPIIAGGIVIAIVGACGGSDLLLPSESAPTDLRVFSGTGQQAQIGTLLTDPLVVEAKDANGRPVSGTRIVFSFNPGAGGGEVNPDTATTDSGGRAEAGARLGSASGLQMVEALALDGAAQNLRVHFELMALAPPAPPPTDGGGDGGGGGGDGGNGGNPVPGGGGNGGGGGGNGGGGGDDDDGEGDDD